MKLFCTPIIKKCFSSPLEGAEFLLLDKTDVAKVFFLENHLQLKTHKKLQ